MCTVGQCRVISYDTPASILLSVSYRLTDIYILLIENCCKCLLHHRLDCVIPASCFSCYHFYSTGLEGRMVLKVFFKMMDKSILPYPSLFSPPVLVSLLLFTSIVCVTCFCSQHMSIVSFKLHIIYFWFIISSVLIVVQLIIVFYSHSK